MAHAPRVLKALRDDADTRFHYRVTLPVPRHGFANQMTPMLNWLRKKIGEDNYAWTQLGTGKVDAACVYFADIEKARAFIDRWPPSPFHIRSL
jgi:hypothetical protein